MAENEKTAPHLLAQMRGSPLKVLTVYYYTTTTV